MMKTLTVRVDNPCSEKWNEMTWVDEMHRHCAACDRVLTDFSKMTDNELAIWFVQSKGKVCGQFSASQLNRKIIIPSEQIKPVSGIRRGLAALWLLPLSLFSKQSTAQQTPHVKQLTDKTIPAKPRQMTIMGTVVNAETGKVIAVANIRSKGAILATTDSSGRFCFDMHVDSTTTITIDSGNDFETMFVQLDPRKQVSTLYIKLYKTEDRASKEIIPIERVTVTAGVAIAYIEPVQYRGTRASRFFNRMRLTVSGR